MPLQTKVRLWARPRPWFRANIAADTISQIIDQASDVSIANAKMPSQLLKHVNWGRQSDEQNQKKVDNFQRLFDSLVASTRHDRMATAFPLSRSGGAIDVALLRAWLKDVGVIMQWRNANEIRKLLGVKT